MVIVMTVGNGVNLNTIFIIDEKEQTTAEAEGKDPEMTEV